MTARSKSYRGIVGLLLLAVAGGCAESTQIRSYPVGARISVNGQFVGPSPVNFTVPRRDFAAQEFTATAEHEGYATGEVHLQKRTCPGRVVGGVFTLGILFLFRPPTCFESPQYVSLLALPAPTPTAEQKPTVSERLEHLDQLRKEGRVTPAEYEKYRRRILDQL